MNQAPGTQNEEPGTDFSAVGPVLRGPAHEPERVVSPDLIAMNQAPGTQNEELFAAAREDSAILEQVRTTFPGARVIATVSAAADQDGYDGGYVAREGDREAWGETVEEAKERIEELGSRIEGNDP